jgi:hypothetical protein
MITAIQPTGKFLMNTLKRILVATDFSRLGNATSSCADNQARCAGGALQPVALCRQRFGKTECRFEPTDFFSWYSFG